VYQLAAKAEALSALGDEEALDEEALDEEALREREEAAAKV